jgi:hypothetical protein
MTKRFEQLAAEFHARAHLYPEKVLASLLEQYGREVRQQALDAMRKAHLPAESEAASPYAQGLRTGGNDALSLTAMDIQRLPLP